MRKSDDFCAYSPSSQADLKTWYDAGIAVLIERHRTQSHSGESVVRALSELHDLLLQSLWQQHMPSNAQQLTCLLAVGGYGRGELNFKSDIDLLLLCQTNSTNGSCQTAIESFIQQLWDFGLTVGQSVRTVEECTLQAKDITVYTNLLENRYLAGNDTLHCRLKEAIAPEQLHSHLSYLNAKRDEQTQRHLSFNDTAYKLEPDIKSSPGGLRDIQTIAWIAHHIYGTSNLSALHTKNILTDEEFNALKDSRDMLWRMRNDLHLVSKRAENRLLFNYQHDCAPRLGYAQSENQLDIEAMMQDYYLCASTIRHLNGVLLQHFVEIITPQNAIKRITLNEHYTIENGYLYLNDPELFQKQPSQILELFLIYQANANIQDFSSSIHRALSLSLSLIDKAFRENQAHKNCFLTFIKNEDRLTHGFRLLARTGVLGAFIPAYQQITGQMQHDLFHAYTVDAHTLLLIRNLRRLLINKHNAEFPDQSTLMQASSRRYRLFLAAFFHDIAKGRGGNHDALGALEAEHYCRALGLSEDDCQFVAWLVRNHLILSKAAQHTDTSDEKVIAQFAEQVIDQEHLDHLYLLTVTDVRATSPTTWTAWKGHLFKQLYLNTTHYFKASQQKQTFSDSARIALKKTKALELVDTEFKNTKAEFFWQQLRPKYFLQHPAVAIAWHTNAICGASALDLPLVHAHYSREIEALEFVIYTAETSQLLSVATGALDKLNLNIVQAKVHVANPGFTLLTLTVSAPQTPDFDDLERQISTIKQKLVATDTRLQPIKRRLPRQFKTFNVKPTIHIQTDHTRQQTHLSLSALDQPGLIHLLANTFLDESVKLVSANISTVGQTAEDSFFITNNRGLPLNKLQIDQLKQALIATLT